MSLPWKCLIDVLIDISINQETAFLKTHEITQQSTKHTLPSEQVKTSIHGFFSLSLYCSFGTQINNILWCDEIFVMYKE